MSVFNNDKASLNRLAFLDPAGPVGIQRYDVVKYPIFLKLMKQQMGFFWRPEEVNLDKDPKDFRSLTEHEQRIILLNISRQIILDSIQGRAPMQVLGPITSLPEVEAFVNVWTFSEVIHSMSYTHIIQNVFPNPTEFLDKIMDNEHIMKLAGDISKHYDALDDYNTMLKVRESKTLRGMMERFKFAVKDWWTDGVSTNEFNYEHKKALWKCLNAINALEGIRFYVSFACTWAFAEVNKMEGNAKIIKLIAKDENLHLAATQNLIKILPKEDPDFARIAVECADEILEIFMEVVNQEIEWAQYLFEDGSMIGLNFPLLRDYVYEIAGKRMRNIGIKPPFEVKKDVLPWTGKWISGSDEDKSTQVAPQETESSHYNQAVTKKKDGNRLKSISL